MARRVITAIDIGSTKVTAVIASVENNVPHVVGVASQPAFGIKKGVVVNIEAATNAIATALDAAERMAGFNVNSVFIGINGKHITSTNNKGVVAISDTSEIQMSDVQRAIESARTISIPNSRNILHIIPREFVVDAQSGVKDPIGMSGSRLEIDTHIISGVSSSITNLKKCVESLGLRIEDIIFTGWASAISILDNTQKQLGVLLLDLGGGTTSICSFYEDSITYSGCIEIGGSSITSDIAICLRITLEEAEKLKVNLPLIYAANNKRSHVQDNNPNAQTAMDRLMGRDKKVLVEYKEESDLIDISALKISNLQKVSKQTLDNIVRARLEEIFKQVKDQIEGANIDIVYPAGVVITGGSAALPNITDVAEDVFKCQVRVSSPAGVAGLTDEISGPAYACVQGILLHASSDNKYEDREIVTGQTLRGSGTIEDNTGLNIFDRIKGFFGGFGG